METQTPENNDIQSSVARRSIDRSIIHSRHDLILSTEWHVIEIEKKSKYGIGYTIGHDSNTPPAGEVGVRTPYYVAQDEDRNLSLKSNDDNADVGLFNDALTWGNPLDAALFLSCHIA